MAETNGANGTAAPSNRPWLMGPGRRNPDGQVIGRAKGTQNKTTLLLKKAILLAAAEAGDELVAKIARDAKLTEQEVAEAVDEYGGLVGYLRWLATKQPQSYASLLGKVLPLQIKIDAGRATAEYETANEIQRRLAEQGLTVESMKLLELPIGEYSSDVGSDEDGGKTSSD